MRTYTVIMRLSGNRGGLSIPVSTLSTEAAAKDVAQKRQHDFAQLMEYPIIAPTGPDGGNMVMTVKQLLNFIGITEVGHFMDEVEVQEGERILQPKIVIAH